MVEDTCNAVSKAGSKLLICDLRLHHEGRHRMGDHCWSDD